MNDVEQLIRRHASGKSVALSVSGGSDSMCLLSLFLSNRHMLQDMQVLTFDHCIRVQSNFETLWVRQYCKHHNVKCTIYKSDIPELSKQSGQSIELQARLWRQQVYDHVLQQVDMVALGHHMDDQIETVLYRIFRGTGIKGLGGMQVLSSQRLLRPLINTSKSAISQYNRSQSVPYVVDQSNVDVGHDRNYIRHNIVPLIRDRWALTNICKLSNIAHNLNEFANKHIDKQAITMDQGNVLIPLCLLDDLLKYQYIEYAMGLFNIKPNYNIISRILGMTSMQVGKHIVLYGDIVARREYNSIRMYSKTVPIARSASIPYEGVSVYKLGDISWQICKTDTVEYTSGIVFDLKKIDKSAIWRHRRIGDTFVPYKGHNKTLKKYLVDNKIPQYKRDKLVLLTVGNTVLLIVGVAISDIIKCDSNTVDVATVRLN
ncbi:MAG: tRNA lysidine(34) synthetase TilS [Clostridiales bacterium]|nr:tRNA lysidine(34) synthetase TilS [Clostridiales bacterium]